jgi:hypothetical protein
MNTFAAIWLALNSGATTPLPQACQADFMSYEMAKRCDAAFAGRVQAFDRTEGGNGDANTETAGKSDK